MTGPKVVLGSSHRQTWTMFSTHSQIIPCHRYIQVVLSVSLSVRHPPEVRCSILTFTQVVISTKCHSSATAIRDIVFWWENVNSKQRGRKREREGSDRTWIVLMAVLITGDVVDRFVVFSPHLSCVNSYLCVHLIAMFYMKHFSAELIKHCHNHCRLRVYETQWSVHSKWC